MIRLIDILCNFVTKSQNEMYKRQISGIIAIFLSLLTVSLWAQKHDHQYNPNALFDEGVLLFQNEEYGAALSTFGQYLSSVSDLKSQQAIDAQYYEAVSALYLGTGDGEAKVKRFVEENQGSTWAMHANFLYANTLFKVRKYREALGIYEDTKSESLSSEESQQLQFNMAYSYFQTERSDRALPLFRGTMLNPGKYQNEARYYYAHIHYVNGNDAEALPVFEQLQRVPQYAKTVPAYIMQINYRNGDYQAVLRDGPEAVRKADTKRKSEMALIVADAFYQQKDYAKALEYYDIYSHYLSGKNLSREACFQMGTCKMKTGNFNGAIGDLQKIAGQDDVIGQYASYYLASCYAKTDQQKYARNAFYSAYAAGFDKKVSTEALFDYAKLSLIPGVDPFGEAVEQLDAYIAENPRSDRKEEAGELAVFLLLSAKDNDKALARLEQMRQRNSKLEGVYNELLYASGIDHYRNAEYDKAQVCFSKIQNSRQSEVQKAEACFWLGESAYAMGNHSAAAKYLTQFRNMKNVSKLDVYPLASYDLGYIYYQKPDYPSAVQCFKDFVAASDDRQADLKSDAYIRLGDCYFMDRDYGSAVNYYDLATRISRRNADYAIYQQALCFGAQGKANQKINMLDEMLRSYPSSGYYEQALFEIGNTYLVHGDKRSSISNFDRLISERPRSPYTRQAMMKVGMLYYNNNQYDKALERLKTLVLNHPNTDESREAMAIIRSIYMEQNQLSQYFAFSESSGMGQVEVTEQDSLAFAAAENFYLSGSYQQAANALQFYFEHFGHGAFLLKAHQYALECAEKVGTDAEGRTHVDYILSQPDNDYTDKALLKAARMEYDAGNYSESGRYYERLSRVTEEPLTRLEALEGGMKSHFFMGNYDTAISMGDMLSRSKDLTDGQLDQINHIVGKSYYEKHEYAKALPWLDESKKTDKSVYGAESAYYSAMASLKLKRYDEAENKVFAISEDFSAYNYWVARSFIALADVYVAKENYFQAKETLRSVIDNYKGDDLKTEARRKLAEVERLEPPVGNKNAGITPIEFEEGE